MHFVLEIGFGRSFGGFRKVIFGFLFRARGETITTIGTIISFFELATSNGKHVAAWCELTLLICGMSAPNQAASCQRRCYVVILLHVFFELLVRPSMV